MKHKRVTYIAASTYADCAVTGYQVSPHFAAVRPEGESWWHLDHISSGRKVPYSECATLREAGTKARALERIRGVNWLRVTRDTGLAVKHRWACVRALRGATVAAKYQRQGWL